MSPAFTLNNEKGTFCSRKVESTQSAGELFQVCRWGTPRGRDGRSQENLERSGYGNHKGKSPSNNIHAPFVQNSHTQFPILALAPPATSETPTGCAWPARNPLFLKSRHAVFGTLTSPEIRHRRYSLTLKKTTASDVAKVKGFILPKCSWNNSLMSFSKISLCRFCTKIVAAMRK